LPVRATSRFQESEKRLRTLVARSPEAVTMVTEKL
jgi:hypothetical protein